MPSSSKSSPSASSRTTLSCDALSFLLGDPTRWKILEVLVSGEAMMVKELARAVGRAPNLVQKHLVGMRKLGLIVVGSGRLNRLAPAFQPQPGSKDIDLGRCVLRFGQAKS